MIMFNIKHPPEHTRDCARCGNKTFCGELPGSIPNYCMDFVSEEMTTTPDEENAMASEVKETNPKDVIGVKKAGLQCISAAFIFRLAALAGGLHKLPMRALFEVGLAMLEGARKYGRHNYRISGVRASVYLDASMRHLNQWFYKEDLDKDSNVCHVVKGLGCMAVLIDSMTTEKWVDDRPPKIIDKLPIIDINATPHKASEWYDAIIAQIWLWWEGGNDELLLGAALSMLELRQAITDNDVEDDRTKGKVPIGEWLPELHAKAAWIIDNYPDCVPPYTEKGVRDAKIKEAVPFTAMEKLERNEALLAARPPKGVVVSLPVVKDNTEYTCTLILRDQIERCKDLPPHRVRCGACSYLHINAEATDE